MHANTRAPKTIVAKHWVEWVSGAGVDRSLLAFPLLLLVAVAIRGWHFGDPNYHVDETWYLYVGDQLLAGKIPYVDLWDRKPIGLFLVYAAIRLLGGDGILQYQIVALLFVASTAVVVVRLAARIASPWAALASGVLSIAFLEPISGGGGQSPAFYNLLVACACLMVVRLFERPHRDRALLQAAGAMLLCGLAIQIKYTAAAEGAFLGLALCWLWWRARGGVGSMLGAGVVFLACGLAPTIAAIAAYAAIGHLDAFWFANFESIFLRPPTSGSSLLRRLGILATFIWPLCGCAIAGIVVSRRETARSGPWRRVLLGWLIAAFAGWAMIGTFYDHYAMPLVPPLAVMAAPLFVNVRPWGSMIAAWAAIWALAISFPTLSSAGRSQREVARLTRLVESGLHGGCLFMFEGPPIVLQTTHACAVTPYSFPYHLSLRVERTGLGVEPVAELRRILRRRPAVIVTSFQRKYDFNPEARAYLNGALLGHGYRLVGVAVYAKDYYLSVYSTSPPG